MPPSSFLTDDKKIARRPSEQSAKKVGGLCDKNILSIGPEDLLEQADAILSEVASLDERAVVTGGGLGVGASASAIYSSEGIESSGFVVIVD